MAILTVNGIQLSVDQNQKLLPFLRDTLIDAIMASMAARQKAARDGGL